MNRAALLLADPSPSLRYLVLKNILEEENSKEAYDLKKQEDPLVKEITNLQETNGSWDNKIKSTAQALLRLGYLQSEHPAITKGVEYIYTQQQPDGSWPLGNYSTDSEGETNYDVISLQTSIPLRALAQCGYATDKRSERAYEWLLKQRLSDGAWPTGIAKGNYGYVAGYRKLPHSRWGCRSNTTGALASLALHPSRRKSGESQRALQHLLGRETRERQSMGYEIARLIGAEKATGFLTYYARFDLVQILDLCWRVEASREDPKVADLVEYIQEQQGQYGLWIYQKRPRASRWITYDILYSLRNLNDEVDWINIEPRTPFQPYPKRRRRY